jgi:hypothetical protein
VTAIYGENLDDTGLIGVLPTKHFVNDPLSEETIELIRRINLRMMRHERTKYYTQLTKLETNYEAFRRFIRGYSPPFLKVHTYRKKRVT